VEKKENKSMKEIIEKLNLKGKITQKHSQEIEEIIQDKLRQAEYKGLEEGMRICEKSIVKIIEEYFKDLIFIPFPEETKKSLINKIIEK